MWVCILHNLFKSNNNLIMAAVLLYGKKIGTTANIFMRFWITLRIYILISQTVVYLGPHVFVPAQYRVRNRLTLSPHFMRVANFSPSSHQKKNIMYHTEYWIVTNEWPFTLWQAHKNFISNIASSAWCCVRILTCKCNEKIYLIDVVMN